MKNIWLLTPSMQLLTHRQLEIFFLLGVGKTINEIGEELFISPRTVSTHKREICRRMGFKNTNQLIYYFIKHHYDREEQFINKGEKV